MSMMGGEEPFGTFTPDTSMSIHCTSRVGNGFPTMNENGPNTRQQSILKPADGTIAEQSLFIYSNSFSIPGGRPVQSKRTLVIPMEYSYFIHYPIITTQQK